MGTWLTCCFMELCTLSTPVPAHLKVDFRCRASGASLRPSGGSAVEQAAARPRARSGGWDSPSSSRCHRRAVGEAAGEGEDDAVGVAAEQAAEHAAGWCGAPRRTRCCRPPRPRRTRRWRRAGWRLKTRLGSPTPGTTRTASAIVSSTAVTPADLPSTTRQQTHESPSTTECPRHLKAHAEPVRRPHWLSHQGRRGTGRAWPRTPAGYGCRRPSPLLSTPMASG